jgi:hypothetical protein
VVERPDSDRPIAMLALFATTASAIPSPFSSEFSFDEFLETPFFTALEVILLCTCGQLVQQVLARARQVRGTAISKRRTGVFQRTKHWQRHLDRFSPAALNTRRTFSIKRAEEPFQSETAMPTNPMLMMLGSICSFGPPIIVTWVLGHRPALQLPFDVPRPLQGFIHMGLSGADLEDTRLMGVCALYFVLNTCSSLIAGLFPIEKQPARVIPASRDYKFLSDSLVGEKHRWVLEDAEEQLLARIDKAGI